MPRWMAAHPHLASRLLRFGNACRYQRGRMLLRAALIAAGGALVAELPPTGPTLGWLGQNWVVTFVIATCLFALSVARRSQRASIEASTSWLAALAAGSPVRVRVILATAGWLAVIVAFASLVWAVGALDRFSFARLAVAVTAGASVGLLAGWRLPRAGVGAPGFHYAIVRRPRARWASAPALAPLGNWPAAQGRIFSRPKKTAPALLIALMAIPSGPRGTPGQVALAVAGACMALFGVFALSAAAVRVAFEAARWLAPTTLGRWRFTAALIWRVALTQAAALTVLVFLTSAIDLPRALRAGAPLAALYLGASLAAAVAASLLACRRAGLGV
jgi:hypothetical protein